MSAEITAQDHIRQFVDTNVLVYAYDRSAGERRQKAERLMRQLWKTRQGCLSIQVLQEFYWTMTHKIRHPMQSQEAASIVRAYSTWRIHVPEAQDVLSAISLQQRFQVSFWDAMIIWSATQLGCPLLWSEDLNDGQHYGTKDKRAQVRNPFA